MLLKKKISLIVLVLVFTFGYVVFSDVVDTRYTEFYFISGGNNYDTITVNLTGGETGTVIYGLENKSTENFGIKMSFVDSIVTDDGNNLKVCLSENEIENFGQYASTNPISFSLSNGSLATGEIELNFPAWFSGVYKGCVLYEPTTIVGNTHLNTVARKAIFLDVNVVPTASTFNVKVYPSNRSVGQWINKGKIMFYSEGNRLEEPGYYVYVDTNMQGGTGIFMLDIPTGIYDIVYKGQGQLASYFSGITVIAGESMVLDFTTGSLGTLYNATTGYWEGGTNDWYQIGGDIRNSNGLYDGVINVNDITILVDASCDFDPAGSVPADHKCDLNGSERVNMTDVSIVLANMLRIYQGPFNQEASVFGDGGIIW